MTTLRYIVALSAVLASSALVFSDEAFDFFVEACRHSGYNPAEIVTFQAELVVETRAFLSDSLIEQHAKHMADAMEAALRKEGKKSEPEIQRAREESVERTRRSFSGEPYSRSIKVFIKNSVAPIGLEDDTPQVKEINIGSSVRPSALYPITTGPSTKAADPNRRTGISQSGRSTIIGVDRRANDAWYFTAGRIGPLAGVYSALNRLLSRDDYGNFSISDVGIATYKKYCEDNERTFTLLKEKVKYEGDNSAYTLQVHEKGQLREQFLIDPDRGYICPKAQVFAPDSGEVWFEVVSENFILDEHSQKWFPEKAVRTSWPGGKTSTEFRVLSGTLVLNKPIPDSIFGVTVQEGTRVDDTRRDDNDKTTFFAEQTGTLDLQTVEKQSLDEIPWLAPREVKQYYSLEKASFGWKRILLMSVGLLMIIIALINMWRNRRKQQ